MHKIIISLITFSLLSFSLAWAGEKSTPVAKISVLSSGMVLLNGNKISTEKLSSKLKKLKMVNGEVMYYRENPKNEPPPIATKIIKIIIDNGLPITLSTKPDFSNYVDINGNIHEK